MELTELWERMQKCFQKEQMEEIVVIFRGLWLRRNKHIFENIFDSPAKVINMALTHLAEYKEAQKRNDERGKRSDKQI